MSWELHSFLRLHHILISTSWYQLIALEHRIRYLIKVTTTYNEDLGLLKSDLNGLEIMWEVLLSIHLVKGNCLSSCIVDVELLAILLHYEDPNLIVVKHLLLNLDALSFLKALYSYLILHICILAITIDQMLVDLSVCSLYVFALGA